MWSKATSHRGGCYARPICLSVVIPCYNAYRLPPPIQFILYLFIGGTAALANLTAFLLFSGDGLPVIIAAPAAFVLAAVVNNILCVLLLFRHKARWGTIKELVLYCLLVVVAGLDLKMTQLFLSLRASAAVARSVATAAGLIFNCLGRRFLIFPEPAEGGPPPKE